MADKKANEVDILYGVFSSDVDKMPDRIKQTADEDDECEDDEEFDIAKVMTSPEDLKVIMDLLIPSIIQAAPPKISEMLFIEQIKKNHPDVYKEAHDYSDKLLNTCDPIDLVYLTKVFNENAESRDAPSEAIKTVKSIRKLRL